MKYSPTTLTRRTVLGMVLLLQAVSVRAQCDWYNGSPTITYLGCATDGSGHVVGRNFRISVPLHSYQRCGPALSGSIFARAVNETTGYFVQCWEHGCSWLGGPKTQVFTLYDVNFSPGQAVRIDYWGKPSSSDLPFVCQQDVGSFPYPPASDPTITSHPQHQIVCQDTPVVFSIGASGGSLTFQWRKDGVEIAGQIGPNYIISSAQPTDSGTYDVRVGNGCGFAISRPATLAVRVPPTIGQQPQAQMVCLGRPAFGTG